MTIFYFRENVEDFYRVKGVHKSVEELEFPKTHITFFSDY